VLSSVVDSRGTTGRGEAEGGREGRRGDGGRAEGGCAGERGGRRGVRRGGGRGKVGFGGGWVRIW